MARKKYGKQIAKVVAAVVLVLVVVIGLGYGSLLQRMDQASTAYSRGDVETALQRYVSIEARLRSLGAIRLIPSEDRKNLLLNQARLH